MTERIDALLSLEKLGPTGLVLAIAPFRIREMERVVIPELAMQNNVHVIVGGHGLDADAIVRAIRSRTHEVTRVVERVRTRRAPTANSMRALLRDTPITREPLVILDMLATFYDPDRALWKSQRALNDSIVELNRLKQLAPVVVTVRPPRADAPEYSQLLAPLMSAAVRVFRHQLPPTPVQIKLF